MEPRLTIECQLCGAVIRELDETEVDRVVDNPYDFVAFCLQHREEARFYDRI